MEKSLTSAVSSVTAVFFFSNLTDPFVTMTLPVPAHILAAPAATSSSFSSSVVPSSTFSATVLGTENDVPSITTLISTISQNIGNETSTSDCADCPTVPAYYWNPYYPVVILEPDAVYGGQKCSWWYDYVIWANVSADDVSGEPTGQDYCHTCFNQTFYGDRCMEPHPERTGKYPFWAFVYAALILFSLSTFGFISIFSLQFLRTKQARLRKRRRVSFSKLAAPKKKHKWNRKREEKLAIDELMDLMASDDEITLHDIQGIPQDPEADERDRRRAAKARASLLGKLICDTGEAATDKKPESIMLRTIKKRVRKVDISAPMPVQQGDVVEDNDAIIAGEYDKWEWH